MDEQTRQQVANFRYGLIAPLVSRKLGVGEQMALMRDRKFPQSLQHNFMLGD